MDALPLYRVRDWNQHYENAKSRTYNRCQYVCVPNKQGGAGWSYVMAQPDGSAIYGIWQSIVQMLSRQQRPREGWLTADGKKEGRRFSVQELSHIFRRDAQELHRCLDICARPQVEWIDLVEGTPEAVQLGLVREKRPAAEPIGDGQSTDTSRIADGYQTDTPSDLPVSAPISGSVKDSIVRKKASLSSAQAREPDHGYQTDSPRIPDGYSELLPTAQDRLTLLGRKRFHKLVTETQWHNVYRAQLSEAIDAGFSLTDLELVEWAYSLPADHAVFDRNNGGGNLQLRQSFETLMAHLSVEAQKIRSARQALGLNGLRSTEKAEPGWPAETLACARRLWGEEWQAPERITDLPASARRELEKALAQ